MRGASTGIISELGIVLGYKCGLRCSHCAVAGFRGEQDIRPAEISLLKLSIRQYSPKTISFTGGEPTRYIRQINNILSAPATKRKPKVRITTNGSFAVTAEAAVKVLGSFARLNQVQLSYDNFHKTPGALGRAGNVLRACAELSVKFNAILTIQSPLDLALLNELRTLGGFPVVVQKVLPVGKASQNGIDYCYPILDKTVLGSKCVNAGKMFYICGRGFSVCCSSLIFNGVSGGVSHGTLREHLESRFYKLVSRKSFSSLLKEAKISPRELLPRHSSPCTLCELIFKEIKWN